MTVGPDVDRAVLWPLILRFREDALQHRREHVQPAHAEHVWAYMTNGAPDSIVGEFVVGIDGHPMMDTDRQLVDLSRPIMEEIARQTGWTIRLVRFDRKGTSIATIEGGR